MVWYIEGLVQDCSISSANALEILQSCAKPLNMLIYPAPVIVVRHVMTHYNRVCNIWGPNVCPCSMPTVLLWFVLLWLYHQTHNIKYHQVPHWIKNIKGFSSLSNKHCILKILILMLFRPEVEHTWTCNDHQWWSRIQNLATDGDPIQMMIHYRPTMTWCLHGRLVLHHCSGGYTGVKEVTLHHTLSAWPGVNLLDSIPDTTPWTNQIYHRHSNLVDCCTALSPLAVGLPAGYHKGYAWDRQGFGEIQ